MNDLDGLDSRWNVSWETRQIGEITLINEGEKSEKKYVGILIVMG